MKTVHCFTDLQRYKNVQPIDVIRVKRQLRLKGNEFVVGLVGEVIERKGHLYLFEAMKEIVEAVPNFKLVLIGRFHRNEAYIKRLRRIQLRDNLMRRVKWLGFRYNVEDFMNAFDVCVVPSLEEPLGLTALEAFAAGTPVVASNVGGLPEIVRHQKNGIIVPPKNPGELAQAIIRMAHDESLRQEFGAAGQAMVAKRFCPSKLAATVEEVYQQVLGQRNQSHARRA